MNVCRYFIAPVVLLSSLTTNVYAAGPANIKKTGAGIIMLDYDFGKFIYSVFVFALILAVAYYVTKIIAKKGTVKTKSKNMKVVETLPIGMEKSVMLVKVGKQYVLLSNTPKNIAFMASFEEDKLGIVENQEELDEFEMSFDTYLNGYSEESGNLKNSITSKNIFARNVVTNNLERLKSMVRGTKSDD